MRRMVAWMAFATVGCVGDGPGDTADTDAPADLVNLPIGAGLAPEGGGGWDPRLAGCTWTERFSTPGVGGNPPATRVTVGTYDAEGWIVARAVEVSTGERTEETFAYDGACLVHVEGETTSPEGETGSFVIDYACDEHGYGISRTATYADRAGQRVEHEAYANAYDGDDLVRVVTDRDDDGTEETEREYRWEDRHVVWTEVQEPPGTFVEETFITFTDADLVETEGRTGVDAEGVDWMLETDWTYDDGDRVLTRADPGNSKVTTWTYEGDAAWPSAATTVYETGEDEVAYEVACE